MTRRRSARGLILAAAGAAAVAGCGNTDDAGDAAAPSTTTRAPAVLTKAQYARTTAEICRRTDRDITAYIPLGTDPATRHANRRAIIAIIRRQNEEIRALGYPSGARRADFDAVYRNLTAALRRAERDDTVDIERAIQQAIEPYADAVARYSPDCE